METTQEQQLAQEEQMPQQDLFADIIDTAPYEKSMNNARIWLYVIAAFQAVMGIIEYNSIDEATVGMIACGIDVGVGLLFLGLALYSKKNPVTAFTIALALYVLIVGFAIYLDPESAFKGILLKALAVIALVKANKDARKYAAIKQSIGE
ncbi:hypothetical protein [Flavisolibacter tropicus]|uniref:DoxX family protein n=1 Tax=Flavisolibacter tropicus TaxID=1492898 RepID=A0A172TWS8_9BACT|nr:hypothetical protein [Flavisolibacter tropicus]ANE51334.1 hypothetical protein SY85_13255 [Flavisolibacter tropicus]